LYINIWWTYVGTLSDSATLLRHNTTKRLPIPVLDRSLYKQNTSIVSISTQDDDE
jgi:hypothetical protein